MINLNRQLVEDGLIYGGLAVVLNLYYLVEPGSTLRESLDPQQ